MLMLTSVVGKEMNVRSWMLCVLGRQSTLGQAWFEKQAGAGEDSPDRLILTGHNRQFPTKVSRVESGGRLQRSPRPSSRTFTRRAN